MVSAKCIKSSSSYHEVTREALEQRERLQNSVIKHTHQIVDQVYKSLSEMESIINQKLSPAHIRRIINYIREDLQPLTGFIKRVSDHAEKIGSLKKDIELRNELQCACRRISNQEPSDHSSCSTSSTSTHSLHSVASYLIKRNARQASLSPTRTAVTECRARKRSVTPCKRSQSFNRADRPVRSMPGLSPTFKPHQTVPRECRTRQCTSTARRPSQTRPCNKSRTRSTSVYKTPDCSPKRAQVRRLWTPPAYKKRFTTNGCASPKREQTTWYNYNRKPSCSRCTLIEERNAGNDSTYTTLTNTNTRRPLVETDTSDATSHSIDPLHMEGEQPVVCQDGTCDLNYNNSLLRRFKQRLSRGTTPGILESVVVTLIVYLIFRYLRVLTHRLAIVYKAYTGSEFKGIPM